MRFLRHACLFACLLAASTAAAQDPNVGTELLGSQEALDNAVHAIIDASNKATATDRVTWRPMNDAPIVLPSRTKTSRSIAPPAKDIQSVLPDLPPPVGTPIWAGTTAPQAIAVDNNGNLFLGTKEALLRIPSEGTQDGATTVTLPAAGVDRLQLDATGKRLLVQSFQNVWLLDLTGSNAVKTVTPHPDGQAWWALEPGKLLFVSESIDMDASQKKRIRLEAMYQDIESGKQTEPNWKPRGLFARLGTLPAAGIRWGTSRGRFRSTPCRQPSPCLRMQPRWTF